MRKRAVGWSCVKDTVRGQGGERFSWRQLGADVLAAAAFVLLGLAAWIAILSAGETSFTFLTFFPAVTLAAMIRGSRAGLAAIILSVLAATPWAASAPVSWAALAIFVASSVLITAVAGAMRNARARMTADVAARTQAEERLRQSQARLSAILENAEDAIIAFDARQCITLFNYGAEQAFGYKAAEVLGQSIDVLIPQRFRELHRDYIGEFGAGALAARRMGQRNRIVGLRKGGEEFPAEATILKLGAENGPVYTTILRDMTETRLIEQELELRVSERTRQLEEEMRRRQETLEALARSQRMEALGNLTGGISHDFNNLLTVISGNHQLIEMEIDEPRLRGYLAEAERAAEMGARLNQRLMTFARQRQLAAAPVDLNETVIGMRELLRRALGEHIVVATELSAGLWLARVDPTEVENALLNLAINARDAMSEGGNLLIETRNAAVEGEQAEAKSLEAGEYVCLSVADTGCGMAVDVAARAFEPFFTTKGQGRGTGLGLATIYGFVKQSGGQVTLWSEPGRGTKISLYLPRLVSGETRPPAAIEEALARGAGELVLLVEDNPAVRRVTAAHLVMLGYRVVEAESARAALGLLENGATVDLVLSDIVMPGGMSGYDLAREIARRPAPPGILLATAFADVSAMDGADAGVRVLRKPYKLAELASSIRKTLDG